MGFRTYFFIKQTGRNLMQSWPTQLMTLLTVSLSVLIFSFFLLIYTNVVSSSERLGDELRLVVYLDEEIIPEMQPMIKRKINDFTEV